MTKKQMLDSIKKHNSITQRFEVQCDTQKQWDSLCHLENEKSIIRKTFKKGARFFYFDYSPIENAILNVGQSSAQVLGQRDYNSFHYNDLFKPARRKLKQY